MAKCDVCRLEMTAAEGTYGCKDTLRIRADSGQSLARLPHHGRQPCHDCGVIPGALHHLLCDVERCPACQGQLLSCGCEVEGEPAVWTRHREEAHVFLHGDRMMVN